MARYAIINEAIIENIIVADEKFIKNNYPNAVQCPENIGVGDGYDGEKFYSNQIYLPSAEIDETLA